MPYGGHGANAGLTLYPKFSKRGAHAGRLAARASRAGVPTN
jgi:hypothetical protein